MLVVIVTTTIMVAKNYKESNKYDLEAQLPISSRVQERIAYDYYAELARSFVHGKLYLLGPYHKDLNNYSNPYGHQAYVDKVIIQDAALFEGKYYIYNGPLPALVYIVGRALLGFYPSDFTVALFLSLCFLSIYSIFSIFVIKSREFLGNTKRQKILSLGILLNIFYFNPISLPYTFLFMNMHGISRSLGLSLIFFPLIFLMYFKSEKSISNLKAFNLSLISSLSILCKFHFLIYVLIFNFLILLTLKNINSFKNLTRFLKDIGRRERLISVISIYSPLLLVLLISSVYNYLRFGSFFDFGFRYQTNGLDLYNNPDQLFPAFDLKIYVAIFIEKFRAYFLAFPSYSEISHFFYPLNETFFKPFDRYYMDSGTLGILCCLPITLCIFYHFFNLRLNSNLFQITCLSFFAAASFIIFFMIPYFSATHYTQEILLGISMLFFLLHQKIVDSGSKISTLLFLSFSFVLTPFVR